MSIEYCYWPSIFWKTILVMILQYVSNTGIQYFVLVLQHTLITKFNFCSRSYVGVTLPCYFNFQAKTAILVGMYKLHFGFMIAERDHSELMTATKYMWHATLNRACLNLSHFHVSIKMTPHFEVYVLRSTYTALILDTRNVILKIK